LAMMRTGNDSSTGDGNRVAISIDSNRLLRLLGKLIASRFPYPQLPDGFVRH